MDTVLNRGQCGSIQKIQKVQVYVKDSRLLVDPRSAFILQRLVQLLYQLYPAGGALSSLLLSRENGGMRTSKCEPSVLSIRNVPLCEEHQL